MVETLIIHLKVLKLMPNEQNLHKYTWEVNFTVNVIVKHFGITASEYDHWYDIISDKMRGSQQLCGVGCCDSAEYVAWCMTVIAD